MLERLCVSGLCVPECGCPWVWACACAWSGAEHHVSEAAQAQVHGRWFISMHISELLDQVPGGLYVLSMCSLGCSCVNFVCACVSIPLQSCMFSALRCFSMPGSGRVSGSCRWRMFPSGAAERNPLTQLSGSCLPALMRTWLLSQLLGSLAVKHQVAVFKASFLPVCESAEVGARS